MKHTFYYKGLTLEKDHHTFADVSAHYDFYSDEACTKKSGYCKFISSRNPIDTINLILHINVTLFFDDEIVKYEYVKNNDEEINTFVSYWNHADHNYYPIGTVNRKIIDNAGTKKLTIFLGKIE